MLNLLILSYLAGGFCVEPGVILGSVHVYYSSGIHRRFVMTFNIYYHSNKNNS